jgi:cytidine deaminase
VLFLKKIILFACLSIGENNINISQSLHAETAAFQKLPVNIKKIINIDILVIRMSKSNTKMSCSLPCLECVSYMKNILPTRGYKLKKIYYSNTEGEIDKTTLKKINEDTDKQHMTKLMKNSKSLNKN